MTYNMNLSQELKNELLSMGASIVGFADLREIPAEKRNNYNYGIVIGIAIKPEVVRKIYPGPSKEYYNEYHNINHRLNILAEDTAQFLLVRDYEAFPMTQKNVKIDQSNKTTILPHKTIATRAGIGWIGKCALLVSEEFGAAIRISTVLTDAELETGEVINSSKCGDCMECKKVCPAKAVLGKNWQVGMERDDFFKALDCRNKIFERGKEIGIESGSCGLCIWACPWTKRYQIRDGYKSSQS